MPARAVCRFTEVFLSTLSNFEDPDMKKLFPFTRVLFAAIAVVFVFSTLALAQEITGSVNGTIKDPNGAAVAGATVTVTDTEKKVVVRTLTTNDDGIYSVPNLQVGVYDLTVE